MTAAFLLCMKSPYALEKLMEQTRKLAAEYRDKTGQTLPVSSELAHFDVQTIFHLNPPEVVEQGIDFVGGKDFEGKRIHIKSRVIFDEARSNHRLGQFNQKANWNYVILVIYDAEYQVHEIFGIDRAILLEAIDSGNKRGAVSVNKFKAIGECLWTPDGLL